MEPLEIEAAVYQFPRFAVLMTGESPVPPEMQSHVTLMMNFFDELRRIAPATKR
jgi:hypothetical protein